MELTTFVGPIGLLVRMVRWLLALRWGRFAHLKVLPKPERRLLGLLAIRWSQYAELDARWPDNHPLNTAEGTNAKGVAFRRLDETSLMEALGVSSLRTFRELTQNLGRFGLVGTFPFDDEMCHGPWIVAITDLGTAAVREVRSLQQLGA